MPGPVALVMGGIVHFTPGARTSGEHTTWGRKLTGDEYPG